jgi:hypothetical protein
VGESFLDWTSEFKLHSPGEFKIAFKPFGLFPMFQKFPILHMVRPPSSDLAPTAVDARAFVFLLLDFSLSRTGCSVSREHEKRAVSTARPTVQLSCCEASSCTVVVSTAWRCLMVVSTANCVVMLTSSCRRCRAR